MSFKTSNWAPEQPLPKYADRKTLAAIITHYCFPVRPQNAPDMAINRSSPKPRGGVRGCGSNGIRKSQAGMRSLLCTRRGMMVGIC